MPMWTTIAGSAGALHGGVRKDLARRGEFDRVHDGTKVRSYGQTRRTSH